MVGGVQARHPLLPSDQDCAGKHGDDDNLVKAQVLSDVALRVCTILQCRRHVKLPFAHRQEGCRSLSKGLLLASSAS